MYAFKRIGAVSFLLGSLFISGCNVMPSDQYQINAMMKIMNLKLFMSQKGL